MSFPPSASLSLSLPFSLPPSASLSVSLCFSLRLSCKRLKAISLLWLWFHSCKDGAPIIGLSWSGCIYTAIYIAIYEFAVTITKRSFKETSLFTDVMVHMQLRVPYLSVFLTFFLDEIHQKLFRLGIVLFVSASRGFQGLLPVIIWWWSCTAHFVQRRKSILLQEENVSGRWGSLSEF